jgi:OOP family OmpA-OmpF porin
VDVISFDRGSRKLQPAVQATVDAVARALREYPGIKKVAIQGHASVDEDNAMKLSEARAQAVLTRLLGLGIDPQRLSIKAYGHDRPIALQFPQQERQRNRRVDFEILEVASDPSKP